MTARARVRRRLPSFLAALAALAVLAVLAASGSAETAREGGVAPLAPGFLEAMASGGAGVTEEGRPLGYFPSPVDLSAAAQVPAKVAAKAAAVSLPARYDLRDAGRIAPARDQGGCGACWAYASLTALATEQLPDQRVDFSEEHLLARHGYDLSPCAGGNGLMAAAYLARWEGPVPEIAGDDQSAAVLGHERQVRLLPDRAGSSDNAILKTAVLESGAVSTTLYYADADYRRATFAYRHALPAAANHAVAIIGWDDDFPAERFSPAAPGKGAFIVQNSWGASWGEGGCFYVSYHDATVGKGNFQFRKLEKAASRDRVYQRDELGWTASWRPGTRSVWMAALHTAEGPEPITSIGFWAAEAGTSYEARVRVAAATEPSAPSDETRTQVAASGVLEYAGYYVIELDKPLALAPGQRFLVSLKLSGRAGYASAPLEAPVPGYSSAARAALGESFLSADGVSWMDLHAVYPNASVCLKAFSTVRGPTRSGSSPALLVPATRLLLGSGA